MQRWPMTIERILNQIRLWRGARSEEVERARAYLLEHFGDGAADEARRLFGVYRRLGARRSARTYRLAARLIASKPADREPPEGTDHG